MERDHSSVHLMLKSPRVQEDVMNLRKPFPGDRSSFSALALGAVLGASAMYLLDPDSGSRRRVRVGTRTRRVSRQTQRYVGRAARDLVHRSRGVLAGAHRSAGHSDDLTLHERIRARLGHVCSHPRAIGVSVLHGEVALAGSILAAEAAPLLDAVRRTQGVRRVVDHLQRHARPDHIPDLQGGGRHLRRWNAGLETPAFHMLMGLGAAAVLGALFATRASAAPAAEQLGDGEENPAFYRHLATTPPMAKYSKEE